MLRDLFRTDENVLKEKPKGSRRISYGTSVTIFFFFGCAKNWVGGDKCVRIFGGASSRKVSL